MQRRDLTGFTLVELMVVIGIIGLLAALVFPIISSAKKAGKGTLAINNLSQICKSLSLYNSDHDMIFPYACSSDDKFSQCPSLPPDPYPLIQDVLHPYVKSNGVWQDPLDSGIPRISTAEFTEIIECQLGGAAPTMFEKYGSSFVYRGDLGINHIAEPFDLVSENSTLTLPQSDVVILHSGYGNWRGGPDVPSKKVVALYGDGHVEVALLRDTHQQGAFRTIK
jgi:prepilin-type N-terminal cleavage/methylation domain-containing protein